MKLKLFAALIAVALVHPLSAQTTPDTEEGAKPYGVYSEGDIDSVSMTSGNLLLHIPVLSYPQRGQQLKFGFTLYYSNKGWTPVNTSSTKIASYEW